MKNNILVSVVTISYNQEKFIENTIKSVLNQNYSNIEFIVIDAGSSDKSREIIKKYDHKISKIIFEQDEGPADGLNKGFKIANGDILCWLNSDDIFLEGTIKKIVQIFDNNRYIDVVYGNAWITNQNGNKIRKFYSDKFNTTMALYGNSIIAQQSTFIKKETYLKTKGFNKYNKITWDSELFLDIGLNNSKFHKINDFLSCYRIHDDGITGSGLHTKNIENEHKKILAKIKNRKLNKFDLIIFNFFKYLRKLLNLNDTYERITKGSVNKANMRNNNKD
jgi:glycosyltransferase involved in cell wall biosynthesis|tara:strand:+ start:1301 stop:2134 length:834 start_codon:yes stop_codon:yes gene_type:complete